MKALILCFLLACGAGTREKTIRATYDVAVAVEPQLVTFSTEHEKLILDTAKTKDIYNAELLDFRSKVDHAEKSLAAVYSAVAAAALANDDASVANLLRIAAIFKTELTALGVLK